MEKIFLSRTIAGEPSSATTVRLSNSMESYGIIRNNDSVVVVAPTAAIDPTEEGDYEYDISSLGAGNYTASWEVTVGSDVQYFTQVFNIDDSVALPDGLYLRDIEQEVARILGPYDDLEVGDSTSNTTLTAYIPELSSSIEYGGIEDRYMLRRGLKSDGTRIAGFNSSDRIRLVASVETFLGVVTSDRAWINPPVPMEIIEFHHLHPLRELRKAVISGLRRCYFWDRIAILTTSAAQEVNLTELIPYLTEAHLVKKVQSANLLGETFAPLAVREWVPFHKDGSVYVRLSDSPYPQNLLVSVLRPASSMVNGVTSLVGPDDDDDLIPVSLEYARAAGHIEAWRYFPRKLYPVAQTKLYPSQLEAAQEFTRKSKGVFRSQPEPEFPMLEWTGYGTQS